jgi:hypothetical protein
VLGTTGCVSSIVIRSARADRRLGQRSALTLENSRFLFRLYNVGDVAGDVEPLFFVFSHPMCVVLRHDAIRSKFEINQTKPRSLLDDESLTHLSVEPRLVSTV